MKKTHIFLTLLAVTLASGLLFVSCPTSSSGGGGNSGGGGSGGSGGSGGGGDTSGTYAQATFSFSYSGSGGNQKTPEENFKSFFGVDAPTPPVRPLIIKDTKAELAAKYNAAKTASGYSSGSLLTGLGLSYSDIEAVIKQGLGSILTEAELTEVLNALKTNGAVMVARSTGVYYWYKE